MGAGDNEAQEISEERGREIARYLVDKWAIVPERIKLRTDLEKREAVVRFVVGD